MRYINLKLGSMVFAFLLFVAVVGWLPQENNASKDDFPVLKGPYLGQKPPGMTPEIFAPGIVSTGLDELSPAFSPDGKEFYFSVQMPTHIRHTMLVMKQKDGRWTKPQVLSFSGQYSDADPAFSPDGNKLFFTTLRRLPENIKKEEDWDIWYVEKTDEGWSEAVNIGAPINTSKVDVHSFFTNDDTLYFSSNREGGMGGSDIYFSRLVNGQYAEPVNIGNPINSEYSEEGFIAPNSSYIIFTSTGRSVGYGGYDLYISFHIKDGNWSEPVNLGENINSSVHDYCPYVSPDGRFLFFTSFRKSKKVMSRYIKSYRDIVDFYNSPGNGNGDIYWVDAKIIEELKPEELK